MAGFVDWLPTINAAFNAAAACCAVAGWRAARAHDRERHRKLMLTALGLSALFLIGYLTRLALAGTTRFEGPPAIRTAYLALLFSHMTLAAVTPFLVLRAVYLAVKDRIAEHRRIVRWAWPIWLYVSVTGVIVYVMLFHVSGSLASS